ncbi:MAG: DUF2007 domain-containing protein [Muribaculaceae bacterium]|nr:DUF2007 domain-containing protein [Muribaculaceae bacterium]
MTIEKNEDLVVFKIYDDPINANIEKGVLETNGVKCMLSNEIMSNVLPITNTTIGEVRLLVFKKDLKLAEEILASPAESMKELDEE